MKKWYDIRNGTTKAQCKWNSICDISIDCFSVWNFLRRPLFLWSAYYYAFSIHYSWSWFSMCQFFVGNLKMAFLCNFLVNTVPRKCIYCLKELKWQYLIEATLNHNHLCSIVKINPYEVSILTINLYLITRSVYMFLCLSCMAFKYSFISVH